MTVRLEVISGPHCGQKFEFSEVDRFLVGRGHKAHFRLADRDQYFSRSHFLVDLNPPQCQLYDLQSTNGTYVNGERVTECVLRDGDRISGGDTEFLVKIIGDLDETLIKSPSPPMLVDQAPAPLPGYEWQELIGSGGMGEVYRAVRVADSATVAIKVIRPAVSGADEDYKRFQREMKILRSLSHPRVVRYLDEGEQDGLLYLVMEYIDSRDAQRLVKSHGPLALDQAQRLASQFLPALQHAHDKGFVHRDVKPSNLLIYTKSNRLQVKLADFGLGRAYLTSQLSGHTQLGQIGGTIAFMPPEQVTDFRNLLPASDQYSAAATLYWMLTGQYAYDFPKAVHAKLAMLMSQPPVPIQARDPETPTQVAEAIMKAMSRDPEDRFQNIAEFQEALVDDY